jgi:hypothetical protein
VVLVAVAALVLVLAFRGDRRLCAQSLGIDASCDVAATAPALSTTLLDTKTAAGRAGTTYDSALSALRLQALQGTSTAYTATLPAMTGTIVLSCSGDFDGDGKADIAAADDQGNLTVFHNTTAAASTPTFVFWATVETGTTYRGPGGMACIDVNNDGMADIEIVRCPTASTPCSSGYRADILKGTGSGSFSKYGMLSKGSFGTIAGEGNHLVAAGDFNGDGKKPDLLFTQSTNKGGQIVLLQSSGGAAPTFTFAKNPVIDKMGFSGSDGPTTIAYADFTTDGHADIAVGGDNTAGVRLYPWTTTGYPSYQTVAFGGSTTSLGAADWNSDGKVDLVVAANGSGDAALYVNNGMNTPFSNVTPTAFWSSGAPATDFDYAYVVDYDNDAAHLPDFIGGKGTSLYITNDGASAGYVNCGTVASDDLDLGSLVGLNISIVDAQIAPVPSAPAMGTGTVAWEASNDGGKTWHAATTCPSDPTQFCVSFSTTAGTGLRWRATMCSSTDHLQTPTITTVATSFTYVLAQTHYRSGPVAQSGMVYLGAFEEPGEAGFLYGIDDASGTTVWEAGAKIDAQTTRNIFTVTDDPPTLLKFDDADASDPDLQATLQTIDTASTQAVVDWWLGPRFGTFFDPHHLGAIENSTPAVLTKPNKPYWYFFPGLSVSDRAAIDTYVAAFNDRPNLVLVGSHDGAIHAIRTNPSNPSDPDNGTEGWAYIPFFAARALQGEMTNSVNTTYPDGSPTLADAKINGAWRTVLIEGGGDGGDSVLALDVTDTIQGTTVVGPTPLWKFSDYNMGLVQSKPAIVRVKKNNAEEWLVVVASGKGATGDKGDSVYALSLDDGSLVWRFDIGDTNCYVATDVVGLETKDETGTAVDGYVDRIVFGDNKGRLWKIDPAADVSGVVPSMGTIDVGLPNLALFSTALTPGALGVERAIAGSIASGVDDAQKTVLYFGTGGTEETPTTAQNDFYAVFLGTGAIRNKLSDNTTVAAGVKFYGGVVYNSGQLIFTNGQDLTGTGLCSASAGQIVAIDANSFQSQFTIATASKIVAPLFVQNGELYTVTLTGQLAMSAYTGGVQAALTGGGGGGGGSGNNGNGNGGGGNNGNGGGNNGNGGGGSGGGGGGSGGSPGGTVNMTGTEMDPFKILSWVQEF